MQIHEVTHVSDVITEAGIWDYVKAATMAKQQPGLANMPLDQRAAAIARDTAVQNLAKVALNQWNAKVYQLSKVASTPDPATGQPVIDKTEYAKQLQDFVDRNLLQGSYKYLDSASKQRVEAIKREIIAGQNDPQKLQQAFASLTPITTTAIQTTKVGGGGGYSGGGPTGAGGQAGGAAAQAQTQGQLPPKVREIQAVWDNMNRADKDALINAVRRNTSGRAAATADQALNQLLTNLGIKLG
jgi:hypothetical protein